LAESLRRAWGIALIEASAEPPPVAAEVGDRPRASAWARREAQRTGLVPNQAHATRALNGFQRLLLAQLDGRQDGDDLLRWLEGLERQSRGQLALTDSRGQPVTDPQRIRAVLRETLDRTLGELRQLGFLVSNPE
jgi:methyltransferase-like protein